MISTFKNIFALLVAITLMPPALIVLGVWMFVDWLDKLCKALDDGTF